MRASRILRLALPACFLVSLSIIVPAARGNELLDMPKPKTEAIEQYEAQSASAATHKFYSKEAKITLGMEVFAWGLDIGFTSNNLAHGGREVGLPVNSCAQVVGLTAGFHFAGEGLAYFLHRTKLHKLERFPRWYLIESSSYCAAYSATHR
jgi:hypothetical protein